MAKHWGCEGVSATAELFTVLLALLRKCLPNASEDDYITILTRRETKQNFLEDLFQTEEIVEELT